MPPLQPGAWRQLQTEGTCDDISLGCGCLGSCWTGALQGGAPPCLKTCADDQATLAALVVLLPYACRVLDYCGNSLKDKMFPPSENKKDKKKKKKGKKEQKSPKGKYEKLESTESKSFTMKKLLSENGNWEDAKEHGWDSTAAPLCAFARIMFCHTAQPVLYWALFSLARADPALTGLSLACGWCVAVREGVYLMATLCSLFVNPAFLLIDVPATVSDAPDDDDDEDGEGGGGLVAGKTFLAAYVSAPQSYVLKALLGKSGLDQENDVQNFVLAGSFALDLCAVAALGSAVGGSDGVALSLIVFYAASAVGGLGAGILYLEEGTRGALYLGLVAVAFGGAYAIGSGKVELASSTTAILGCAALALGYMAFTKSVDGDGDGGSDSDEESSDDDQDDSDDEENPDSNDDDDDGQTYVFGGKVEVFSKSANSWCEGTVKAVDKRAGTVQVEYMNTTGALMQKVLMDDSDDLKTVAKKGKQSPRHRSGSNSDKKSSKKTRARADSKVDKELARKEEKDEDFRYEVRAEFKSRGKMGFEFEQGPDDEVVVKKVKKKSAAADVEHACEGMILRCYETRSGSRWKKKEEPFKDDYEDLVDKISDSETRPIRLYFEYPWQYVPGKKKKPGKWSNWYTEEEEDERPKELLGVYASMNEWMDGGESDSNGGYSGSDGDDTLRRTNTSKAYGCRVVATRETGSFNTTMRYTIRCDWQGFSGESEHRYSGACWKQLLPARYPPDTFDSRLVSLCNLHCCDGKHRTVALGVANSLSRIVPACLLCACTYVCGCRTRRTSGV
jgi:hypothetical protein